MDMNKNLIFGMWGDGYINQFDGKRNFGTVSISDYWQELF